MKRMVTLTLMLMLVASMAFAGPTDKGVSKLGGTISFESRGGDLYENGAGDKETYLTFAPSYGYFIANNICIGADVIFFKDTQGDNKYTDISFGPMVSYFFGNNTNPEAKGSVFPYVSVHFLIGNEKSESSGGENKWKGTTFGGRVGGDYFVTNSVAVDFGLNFSSDSWKLDESGATSYSGTRFGFSAGVSAFVY